MRQIDAGDVQRIISAMDSEGLDPKTIRNLWGIVSLIWAAALSQKYVDSALPKPKLPRKAKKKPKFFTLTEVAAISWLRGMNKGFSIGLRLKRV